MHLGINGQIIRDPTMRPLRISNSGFHIWVDRCWIEAYYCAHGFTLLKSIWLYKSGLYVVIDTRLCRLVPCTYVANNNNRKNKKPLKNMGEFGGVCV